MNLESIIIIGIISFAVIGIILTLTLLYEKYYCPLCFNNKKLYRKTYMGDIISKDCPACVGKDRNYEFDFIRDRERILWKTYKEIK